MYASVIYVSLNVAVAAVSLAVVGMMMMLSYGVKNYAHVYSLQGDTKKMCGSKCKSIFHT
jgi:hypothetical protein